MARRTTTVEQRSAATERALAILGAASPMATYRAASRDRAITADELYRPLDDIAPLPRARTKRGSDLAVQLLNHPRGSIGAGFFGVLWIVLSGLGAMVGFISSETAVGVIAAMFSLIGFIFLIGAVHGALADRKLARVEIDAEPAFLGQALRVRVSQPGPVHLNSIRVELVCREEVSYRQGTDLRTEKHEVFRRLLTKRGAKTIARGESWTKDLTTVLPAGPHSFEASSNRIVWTIHVVADIANWPDYDRHFLFRALPRPVS